MASGGKPPDEATALLAPEALHPTTISSPSPVRWRGCRILSEGEKRDLLFGDEEEHKLSPEEKSSFLGSFLYTWLTKDVYRAARAEFPDLSGHPKVLPLSREDTSWVLVSKLYRSFDKERLQAQCWAHFVGESVRAKRDRNSRGTLRWIGYLRRSESPRKLMVGIEWTTPPQGMDPDKFHDGTVDGETLFRVKTPRHSSCEDPNTVRFVTNIEWSEALLQRESSHSRGSTSLNAPLLPGPAADKQKKPTLAPKGRGVPRAASLGRAIYDSFGTEYILCGFYQLVIMACILSGPVFLQYLIQYLKDESASWKVGIALASAMTFAATVQNICTQKYLHCVFRYGTRWVSAITGLIFLKSLSISSKSQAVPEMSAGRIVNMISNDVQRMDDASLAIHFLWSLPLETLVVLGLMYRLVGVAAFCGVVALLIGMPAQGFVMRRISSIREKLVQKTDERIKATNELLCGIRVVKFTVWEEPFTDNIMRLRVAELEWLRKMQVFRVLSEFISYGTPCFVSASVFAVYHLLGNVLTPEVVFPTFVLLDFLEFYFHMIPQVATMLVNWNISAVRIASFLELEDAQQDVGEMDAIASRGGTVSAIFERASFAAFVPSRLPQLQPRKPSSRVSCRCCSCCCCYEDKSEERAKREDQEEEAFTLQPKTLLSGVTLQIPKGKLTIVCGPTGCGKGALLESMLNSFELISGTAFCEKHITYVGQQPWIMNASLKDNVLFYELFDAEKFNRAIECCQLSADIEAMVDGIDTQIGEKGVTLSGGQKSRVALARAVYCGRCLVLLDDPLSAVDAHVGQKLMSQCIVEALRGTTRILATHQLQFLPLADQVVLMAQGGQIEYVGPYDMARMPSGMVSPSPVTSFEMFSKQSFHSEESGDGGDAAKGDEFDDDSIDEVKAAANAPHKPTEGDLLKPMKALMTEEEKAAGNVSWSMYRRYFDACGGTKSIAYIVAVFSITQLVILFEGLWLAWWSGGLFGISQDVYLYVYVSVVLLDALSSAWRAWVVLDTTRVASLSMHRSLLHSVALAPLHFFDSTPVGRILNRFSHDVDSVDDDLPWTWLILLQLYFSTASRAILMTVSQPFALLALIPSAFAYYRILIVYKAALREIRRVTSIMKSPIFALMSEVLAGCKTITAFNKIRHFVRETIERLDSWLSAEYFRIATNRWLSVRLGLLGNIIVSVMIFAAVLCKISGVPSTNVAFLSLGITLAMDMTNILTWVIRSTANVETDMNAVERIVYYTLDIPHEECWVYDEEDASGNNIEKKPSSSQAAVSEVPCVVPRHPKPLIRDASIEMRNVSLRYREGLPLVLNNLSFCVRPGEKVGIVGRTGSGKSSVMLALLRMVEICDGEILVGGVNARHFKLSHLRRTFAMIPQDSLLFEGTVRSNLDPFSEAGGDEKIWRALDQVGMTERIRANISATSSRDKNTKTSFDKGSCCSIDEPADANPLDSVIMDGGRNMSVGQRQLLCLARALLRRDAQVILMDEATANIDLKLDAVIQKTIRTAFASHTVVTIAHRLNSVLDSDRILVMENGHIGESGSPMSLALNPSSLFRKMLASLGHLQEKKLLRKIMTHAAASSDAPSEGPKAPILSGA